MGIESYRHRYDGELRLTPHWYVDPEETNHLWESLDRGELTFQTVDAIYHRLLHDINLLEFKTKEQRNSSEEDIYQTANSTMRKLEDYRKNLRNSLDNPVIDNNEYVN